MRTSRLPDAALEAYESEPVPTWRRSGFWTTSLRGLDLDALEPKRYEPIEELPQIVKDDLGDEDDIRGRLEQLAEKRPA